MQLGTFLQITKREWYALGGFANTRLFRKSNKRGWRYFMLA